jgi:carbon-monoxide dehydrogenase medium subunit
MVSFDYIKPNSLDDLLEQLSRKVEDGSIIAGGTDLLVRMRAGSVSPKVVYDINNIKELSRIRDLGDSIAIGPMVKMFEIVQSDLVRKHLPFLAEAAEQVGSPQIRNRATVGGNILTASPCADTVPPLMVSGARLKLKSVKDEREIKLENFMKHAGLTDIKTDELLIDIIVPKMPEGYTCKFLKLGRRKSLAISVINMAGWAKLSPEFIIEDIRIVLGSVAPTAFRATVAEKFLTGKKADTAIIKKAAIKAVEQSAPISDIRGTKDDRSLLIEVWVGRLLQILNDK